MMISPEISLLVDLVGMALLAAVIVYAVRLNARLSSLKADKKELEGLLGGFARSTERAENALARLKVGSAEAGDAVGAQLAQARELRDDLSFMVERAADTAERLENAIRDSRERGVAPGAAKPAKTAKPAGAGAALPERRGSAAGERDGRGGARVKEDLLKTLQGMR